MVLYTYLSLFGLEGLSRRYGVYSEGVGVYLEVWPYNKKTFCKDIKLLKSSFSDFIFIILRSFNSLNILLILN